MATFFVHPAGPRPDFRLVRAFVWGDAEDCDTDGNARYPADREWTELYARSRSRSGEGFNVFVAKTDPLVLEVESPAEWLAAAVAHLLAQSSAGSISSKPDGPLAPAHSVLSRVGEFDVRAGWDRY